MSDDMMETEWFEHSGKASDTPDWKKIQSEGWTQMIIRVESYKSLYSKWQGDDRDHPGWDHECMGCLLYGKIIKYKFRKPKPPKEETETEAMKTLKDIVSNPQTYVIKEEETV